MSGLATPEHVKDLLASLEDEELSPQESEAYDYLFEAVYDDLWTAHSSIEVERLWGLCHGLLQGALARRTKDG